MNVPGAGAVVSRLTPVTVPGAVWVHKVVADSANVVNGCCFAVLPVSSWTTRVPAGVRPLYASVEPATWTSRRSDRPVEVGGFCELDIMSPFAASTTTGVPSAYENNASPCGRERAGVLVAPVDPAASTGSSVCCIRDASGVYAVVYAASSSPFARARASGCQVATGKSATEVESTEPSEAAVSTCRAVPDAEGCAITTLPSGESGSVSVLMAGEPVPRD